MKYTWKYKTDKMQKMSFSITENIQTDDLKKLGPFGAIRKWHSDKGMNVTDILIM